MARTKADDVRDARRALKIKNQAPTEITTDSKGMSKGWNAKPTVSKSKYGSKLNPDGFRIDWDEKHHINGLNLYERYTEGMSPEQIAKVDAALKAKGLTKGNVGPNRIDLPRRLHTSSKYPGIEGAHQVTQRLGIDSPAELERLSKLSPDEKFGQLNQFITNTQTHSKVGQQKYMEQFTLQPGNNAKDNVFGGNFSQQVLQTRDKDATAAAASALKTERAALTSSATPPKSTRRALTRGAKWLPLAGAALALTDAGSAFAKGNHAEGAAHTLGAAVGEVPIVGDAAVELATGSPVADGTVTGVKADRANRPTYYGQKGPDTPSPEQSERAKLLRKKPSSERGYETLGRLFNEGRQSLMNLFGK